MEGFGYSSYDLSLEMTEHYLGGGITLAILVAV